MGILDAVALSPEERLARKADFARIRREFRRMEALSTYGGKCEVCGNSSEDDLMIVPRGESHWWVSRTGKPLRGSEEKLTWLYRNNYPDSFTLACSTECKRILQTKPTDSDTRTKEDKIE